MKEFYKAVNFVLKHEGGYSNDTQDPGGETKFGISKRAYPNLDIKNLTRDQAIEIYKRDYWDRLPKGITESVHGALFDCAVNTGITRAIKLLQSAIKTKPDGEWGSKSSAALAKFSNNEALLRFSTERIMFYTSISTFNLFGSGWVSRVVSSIIEFKEQ